MRRALLVVSMISLFATATAAGCSDDERPAGITPNADTGGDTGLPIFESGVDTSVNPMDDGLPDSGTPTDSGMGDGGMGDGGTDTTVPTDTNVGDVVEIDAMMTRDTAIDAIRLEAGDPDTRSDTDLPDVLGVSDTRIDSDPDAPMPPPF